MENTYIRSMILILLAAACLFLTVNADGSSECSEGAACFPDGVVPEEITSKDLAYYCCLEKNTSRRHSDDNSNSTDGTRNCSCVPNFTLDDKIQRWAQQSNNRARMCNREEECEGAAVSTTWNLRFKFCCWDFSPNVTHLVANVTSFDGDKEEYIGCRCDSHPLPTPDTTAYTVPPVPGYMSTGEACSYDAGCQDRPSLSCESHWPSNVTFCCYGSRGLVTANEDDRLTQCTCTNEVYGAQCAADPIAIANTSTPCLTECNGTPDDDKCTSENDGVRCCPHNMVVVATQTDGNFTSCTCKAQEKKQCKVLTSSARRVGSLFSDVIVTAIAAAVYFGQGGRF